MLQKWSFVKLIKIQKNFLFYDASKFIYLFYSCMYQYKLSFILFGSIYLSIYLSIQLYLSIYLSIVSFQIGVKLNVLYLTDFREKDESHEKWKPENEMKMNENENENERRQRKGCVVSN